DIKAATNDFDESLVVGSGGFGKVYRGVLADGTKIAVKRAMPGSKQGFPEFQTEILVLSGIRHRHLVALIGYCEEQSERLWSTSTWRRGRSETHVTTGVKGTFGYFDPEYFKTQKLTDKSDVYSFGVMLFEVLCARPVIDRSLSMEQLNLAEWALHWQRRGQLEKIIDQRLVGKINTNSLRKFGETAEKCVAEYGIDRPAFADILWNLEYALQLHVTELKREPHEDSGAVESQISVAAMRDGDSAGLNVDEANDRSRMTSEGQSDLTASIVFSQLVTDEGR
ncbi:receptor-like protein kinase, partial [Musa troglodytarum]